MASIEECHEDMKEAVRTGVYVTYTMAGKHGGKPTGRTALFKVIHPGDL